MTTGQLPSDGVFRLRPIKEGADAAVRVLMALEYGLSPSIVAAKVKVSRKSFDKFVQIAREGKMPRGRFPAADVIYSGKTPPIVHPLGRPHLRAVAMQMMRPEGIFTGDIEALLVAAQKTAPVANIISEMRKRLKPYGIKIGSTYSGRFRTCYTVDSGREALLKLIEEAIAVEKGTTK